MDLDLQTIVVCLLSSTLAATLVTSIKELVIWFLNRRAQVEDSDVEDQHTELRRVLEQYNAGLEKVVKSVEGLEKKLSIYLEDYKIILKDKIKYLVLKYYEIGEITLDEKQAINHMWSTYHYDLEGNGDLDEYMHMLEEIPVVKYHSEPRGGIYR